MWAWFSILMYLICSFMKIAFVSKAGLRSSDCPHLQPIILAPVQPFDTAYLCQYNQLTMYIVNEMVQVRNQNQNKDQWNLIPSQSVRGLGCCTGAAIAALLACLEWSVQFLMYFDVRTLLWTLLWYQQWPWQFGFSNMCLFQELASKKEKNLPWQSNGLCLRKCFFSLWNMFYISAKFQWNIKPKEIHLDCRSCAVFMHECQAIKHVHRLCILLVGGPWKLPLSILSNIYMVGSLLSDIEGVSFLMFRRIDQSITWNCQWHFYLFSGFVIKVRK